jgi:hypothetical protein
MPVSLLNLIVLQFRGFVRRTLRGATSPRRAVFLLIGLTVILLWLMPPLLTRFAISHEARFDRRVSLRGFRETAPVALLGICLVTTLSSAGDKAVAFTAGEVDMLFPGPYSRRQLLAFKLLKSGLAALFTGLLFSVLLLPYISSWLNGYIGIVLTLLFIQWFCTAGVLLGQALGQRLSALLRGAVAIGAVALAAVIVRQMVGSYGGIEGIYHFRNSQLGYTLLQPFEPFGDTIAASSRIGWAMPAAKAALTDAVLLGVVVLLDTSYLEAALSASQRRYAQLQRIRSGSLLSSSLKGEMKWGLPRPRWLGGAGPVIWRQATTAARSAKGLLLVMLLIAIATGPLLASIADSIQVSTSIVPALVWATVLLSGLMKFDFRGDLDHFDSLKALPIPPAAIAVGQLAAPTLILTLFHVIMLVGVSLVAGPEGRGVLLTTAALALPFNALLMASDNLIFLLFPARPAAASPGDFQMLGRQAAQLIMKGLAVMVGCLVAFGIAIPVYILAGGSLIVLALLAGTILAGEAAALVPLVARAFERFDPSTDMPA